MFAHLCLILVNFPTSLQFSKSAKGFFFFSSCIFKLLPSQHLSFCRIFPPLLCLYLIGHVQCTSTISAHGHPWNIPRITWPGSSSDCLVRYKQWFTDELVCSQIDWSFWRRSESSFLKGEFMALQVAAAATWWWQLTMEKALLGIKSPTQFILEAKELGKGVT